MLQTKCCKRPTCSIDSELSRDLWLPAHLSSLALGITYGGYWNLSVFNLFLHGLGFRGSLSALPSSGLIGPPVPQQLTNPGLSCAILYRMLWVLGLFMAWHQLPHLVCLLIPQDLEWEMWTSLLNSSNYSKKLSCKGNNSANSCKSNSCSPLRCSKASNFDSLEALQCLRPKQMFSSNDNYHGSICYNIINKPN